VPGPGDTAVLGSIAAGANAPTVRAGTPTRPEEVCDSILLNAGFAGKTLTIEGRLRVTGFTQWIVNAAIAGPGALAINDRFIWTQGAISVKNLYVHSGGQFFVRENAATLTSDNITIGASATGELSTGSMRLGLGGAMNQYLQLGDATIISIKPQGSLEFWQSFGSPWAGGLSGGVEIDNEGLVSRAATDDNGLPLYISTPVINLSLTSVFRIVPGSELYINNPPGVVPSFWQKEGRTELGDDSTLDVIDAAWIEGGNFVVQSGVFGVHLNGDLVLTDEGILVVGDGIYTTFHVTGNAEFLSGKVQMSVNGAANGECDSIYVEGGVDLRNSTTVLQVTTDNQVAPVGNQYDIITAGFGFLGDFGSFEWLGFDQQGYQRQITPDGHTYRLVK
jgi:hypothetical protein